MKLLEKYTTQVVLGGIDSFPLPVGVSVVAVAGAVNLSLAIGQNNRVSFARLFDMRFSPATSGVVSLESASLLVESNIPQPFYRSLSPSSLTALVDGNVVGLSSQWVLPGAALARAVSGLYELLNISAIATLNNTSAAAVNLSTTALALLMTVELYDTPQYD